MSYTLSTTCSWASQVAVPSRLLAIQLYVASSSWPTLKTVRQQTSPSRLIWYLFEFEIGKPLRCHMTDGNGTPVTRQWNLASCLGNWKQWTTGINVVLINGKSWIHISYEMIISPYLHIVDIYSSIFCDTYRKSPPQVKQKVKSPL